MPAVLGGFLTDSRWSKSASVGTFHIGGSKVSGMICAFSGGVFWIGRFGINFPFGAELTLGGEKQSEQK
jgi:hypothetical protein